MQTHMGMDKDDRSQSLSTAYVPVICTVPQEQLDFNTFLIICFDYFRSSGGIFVGIIITNPFDNIKEFAFGDNWRAKT